MATDKRRTSVFLVAAAVLVLVLLLVLLPNLRSSGARPVVGEPIQDFTVTDSEGVTFKLSEEYAKGPVILIFYRGYWCGICQNQLKELEQIRPDVEALGAQMVAISTDSRPLAQRVRDDLGLGIRVIPDDRLKLLRMFDHSEIYSNEDIFNPAIYVIDQEGIVRWGYFGEDAADRPPTPDVYQAVVDVVQGKLADTAALPLSTRSATES